MKHTSLLLFWLITIAIAQAQMDSVMISGVIYDYETQETLKNASFKHNGEFIDVAEDGTFQLYVKADDSLSFKYTGYKDYVVIIPKDLDHVSYISGVFLNKESIAESKAIVVPREYKVESLATYDPMERKQLMANAQKNIAIASYQASQPYEMDATDNARYSIDQKHMEIEYKGSIAPNQMIGAGIQSSLADPFNTVELDKQGEKGRNIQPLSTQEVQYIKALFESELIYGPVPDEEKRKK